MSSREENDAGRLRIAVLSKTEGLRDALDKALREGARNYTSESNGVYTNVSFSLANNEAVEENINVEFVFVYDDAELKSETVVEQLVGDVLGDPRCKVVFGEPKLVQPHLPRMDKIQWYQSTWAGNDGILRKLKEMSQAPDADRDGGMKLTKVAGVFGPHISEYCLALIIGHERRFAAMQAARASRAWANSSDYSYRLLSGLTVGVMGMGSIGAHVAKTFKMLGATVVSYSRTPRENDPCHFASRQNLPEFLSRCDYVINTLPSSAETVGLLSGDALKAVRTGGVFINVGRGNVIDDDSLLRALEQKWIAHAYLDVFNVEPLPSDHPFWSMPDITITPHVSAVSFAPDVCQIFVENFLRYLRGERLLHEMNADKGY